jgi:hypothetical protein
VRHYTSPICVRERAASLGNLIWREFAVPSQVGRKFVVREALYIRATKSRQGLRKVWVVFQPGSNAREQGGYQVPGTARSLCHQRDQAVISFVDGLDDSDIGGAALGERSSLMTVTGVIAQCIVPLARSALTVSPPRHKIRPALPRPFPERLGGVLRASGPAGPGSGRGLRDARSYEGVLPARGRDV